MLRRHLDLIDELSRQIDKLDMRIVAVTDIPFRAALDLLESMSKFPTAGHFAS